MNIILTTQVRENYGAHDWDGEGEVPQYWKNKGGDVYVFTDVTVDQAKDAHFWAECVRTVSTVDSDYYTEVVIDEELLDELPEDFGGWDTPIFFTREEGKFVAYRQEGRQGHWTPGIIRKEETWVQANGERSEYVVKYFTEDGKVLDWEGKEVA